MLKRFFPSDNADSIYNISYESLAERKIAGLIFDVDNTLVPYDVPHPTDEVVALFARLRGMGFKIALLSNNNGERLSLFNEKLRVTAVPKAGKPGSGGVEKALSEMGTSAENTVLIGDQVFTDIWCANRCDIYSILVKPISEREEFFIKPKRFLEGFVLRLYFSAKKSKLALNVKKGYNNKGFTLSEVVVVLAVMAFTAGIVPMSFPSEGTRVLDEVCRTLQADMRLAQRLSVIEGRRYRVEFDSVNNSYAVLRPVTGSASKLVKRRQFDGKTELLNITGNTDEVEYTPTGTTGDACTVTLRDNNYLVNLTINVGSGRIEKKEFIKI